MNIRNDFTVTQDQADTLNARIAADKETTMQTTTATNEERRLTLGLTAKLTKKEQKEYDQLTAAHDLAKLIQPGDTVYAIIDSVSRSGMSRNMRLYVIKDNEPRWITRDVATLHDNPMRHGWIDSMHVTGCGMDMIFHEVYALGRRLFGDGYALKHRQM